MNKTKSLLFLCLFLFFVFIFYSCKSPFSENFGEILREGDIIEGTGTITYIGVEGGFYGIITANDGHWDNGHWDPINLRSEFTVDGLRVKFKAKIRDDLHSYHMWGRIIELIYIKKL
ncbi:MAG: hypothetical protein KAW19_05685 [Candidatus Aminicenantes bacterium]|nr:hypothetical protein [Candidatus Aminicenantes bacterium]